MSYKYAVVWFQRAKSYMKGSPRPLEQNVKCFHSLERARKFSEDWSPPAKIYELLLPSIGLLSSHESKEKPKGHWVVFRTKSNKPVSFWVRD